MERQCMEWEITASHYLQFALLLNIYCALGEVPDLGKVVELSWQVDDFSDICFYQFYLILLFFLISILFYGIIFKTDNGFDKKNCSQKYLSAQHPSCSSPKKDTGASINHRLFGLLLTSSYNLN